MATILAFLAIAALIGAFYFIYSRSQPSGSPEEHQEDLQRFLVANRELRLERIDNDLWSRAIALAHGDHEVARARYVELRVRQMKEQAAAAKAG